MNRMLRIFGNFAFRKDTFKLADVAMLSLILIILFVCIRLGSNVRTFAGCQTLNLSPRYLPVYVGYSLMRMFAAYIISLAFTFCYGHLIVRSTLGEKVLIPLLDVLQSVPMFSFLPVALIAFGRIFPPNVAAELSSVFLLFTCFGWNITFLWYQSLITIPAELNDTARLFKFNWWMRFQKVEFPFASVGLVWNSMLSWAGGWFFLMAAEMFQFGTRDVRLLGIGSYLQKAASAGDKKALFFGILILICTILILDQMLWRPLLCWAERFRVNRESAEDGSSWFYNMIRGSKIINYVSRRILHPVSETIDGFMIKRFPFNASTSEKTSYSKITNLFTTTILVLLICGGFCTLFYLRSLTLHQWTGIFFSTLATFLRVFCAVVLSLAWTLPVGVAIGLNKRLSRFCRPMIQLVSSFPATALFPVLLFFLIGHGHNLTNLNVPAIILMVLGSQWYLLFNVIAGASQIPQDLKITADILKFSKAERWKILIMPAIFPFLVTGLITTSGGCWNVSIIAEYVRFASKTYKVNGLGALIAEATSTGNYHLLFASTLCMITAVVLINRFFWKRLYLLAENKFRME